MLENFLLTVNILVPLFIIMAIGYVCRRGRWLGPRTINIMNRVSFRVFIPVMILENILSAEKGAFKSVNIFIFAFAAIFLSFLILWFVIPRIEKDDRKRPVLIQGIMRSNYVLFGAPLVKEMCPNDDYAIASLLVILVVPLFNVLSVIALETYRGGKADFKKILFGIIKNPLIIASVLGFILMNIPIKYPYVITKAVSDISSIATPLALFLLGASFEFKKVRENIRPLLIGVSGKLVWMPLVFVTAAVLLGFRGAPLAAVIVIFGSPSAVNSFTMAQQMGADGDLAGEQVVLSSVFSLITMFIIIFICKQFAFI